uniref:Uncharacterized protein n=1 Tax=Romanomermis culicivorax TaxID=13658 RepID=A0A915ITG6_ROMCU
MAQLVTSLLCRARAQIQPLPELGKQAAPEWLGESVRNILQTRNEDEADKLWALVLAQEREVHSDVAIAALLSQLICSGACCTSATTSAKNRANQVPSCIASTAAFTSASAVDVATHGCRLLDHDTSPPPTRKQKPDVERCIGASSAYDESQYPSTEL